MRKALKFLVYSFLVLALALIFPVALRAQELDSTGSCILPTPMPVPPGGFPSGPVSDALFFVVAGILSALLIGFYVFTALTKISEAKNINKAGIVYFLCASAANVMFGVLAHNLWISAFQLAISASFFIWFTKARILVKNK